MKTALLFGSSGLVGGQVLNRLTNDVNYSKIKIFVRSEPKIQSNKLEIIKTDFNDLENFKDYLKGDDCFFSIDYSNHATRPRIFNFNFGFLGGYFF